MYEEIPGANGHIMFFKDNVMGSIYGGPYKYKPNLMFGVKIAAEIHEECDVSIPTLDFSLPDEDDLRKGIIKTIGALAAGESVYVGCMGGVGRTGLFIAVMAKVMGMQSPVAWVRNNYLHYAVETPAQEAFVEDIYVDDIAKWVKFL